MKIKRKAPNLYQIINLLAAMVLLQACTCSGILNVIDTIGTELGLGAVLQFSYFWDAAQNCDSLVISPAINNADGSYTFTWSYHINPGPYTTIRPDITNFYFAIYNGETLLSDTVTLIENWKNADPNPSVTLDIDWAALGNPNSLQAYVHVFWSIDPTGAYKCPTYLNFSQPTPPSPPPPSFICENLRLTSPLGGLPNGWATFYWDTLENAVSYRINVYSAGNYLMSFEAAAPNTNLQGDVSQGAIGGESPLTVEIIAFAADGRQCSQSYTIAREAAPSQLPPPVAPPPEATEKAIDCDAQPERC